MGAKGDKSFAKDFSFLISMLMHGLEMAETEDAAQFYLEKLEILATTPKAPATAKTYLGIAYLMKRKPWYDFGKGFEWVKKGANEARENEPFCWFWLGYFYLCGTPELPQDLISAKHWIEKAAAVGYKDAITVRDKQWG